MSEILKDKVETEINNHFYFWLPTNKTWTIWACIISIMLSLIAFMTCHTGLSSIKNANLYLIYIALLGNIFDAIINICNLFVNNWDQLALVSEGVNNICQLLLLLTVTNNSSHKLGVSITVGAACIILLLQIYNKDKDYGWLRALAYMPLFMIAISCYNDVSNNYHLMAYFSVVTIAMIFDSTDFPEYNLQLQQWALCEAFVLLHRGLGVYLLILTRYLQLKNDSTQFSTFELFLKSIFGF